jgi:uncharacterized membrane protein
LLYTDWAQDIHLFAYSENLLSNFSKAELLSFKKKFITEFAKAKHAKMIKKITEHGTPYFISSQISQKS